MKTDGTGKEKRPPQLDGLFASLRSFSVEDYESFLTPVAPSAAPPLRFFPPAPPVALASADDGGGPLGKGGFTPLEELGSPCRSGGLVGLGPATTSAIVLVRGESDVPISKGPEPFPSVSSASGSLTSLQALDLVFGPVPEAAATSVSSASGS